MAHTEVDNSTAKSEITKLFLECPISTPKPEKLLERVIYIASNPVILFLILSWFGTTAAVAHKMDDAISHRDGEHALPLCARCARLSRGTGGISTAVTARWRRFPLLAW